MMANLINLLLYCLIAILPLSAAVVERQEPIPRREVIEQQEPAKREIFNTVSIDGEYTVSVPGRSSVSPGPAYILWQFNLLKEDRSAEKYYESHFLADVQPVTREMAAFQEEFLGDAGAYMLERAADVFGDLLQEIAFATVPGPEGATIYVMDITLSDGERPMRFTATWRFEKSYVASYLGVDMGDGPDMRALTLEAADRFQDHTAAPDTANPQMISTGAFAVDPGLWYLPVKNVLGVINEYAMRYRPFRSAPDAEETAIEWRNDFIEAVAREVAGKPEGPVYPSELEHIVHIDFTTSKTEPGLYTFTAYGPFDQLDEDDVSYSFRAVTPLRDIHGLEYFRGVQRLKLSLPDVRDVSALKALDRVEYAFLSFSPEITDLSPMGGMLALQELMMWGHDYSMVKDISFFESLAELETVYFINTGISDASVFTRMPALTELYLNAADTLDKRPLINCERIEKLLLNTEEIR